MTLSILTGLDCYKKTDMLYDSEHKCQQLIQWSFPVSQGRKPEAKAEAIKSACLVSSCI